MKKIYAIVLLVCCSFHTWADNLSATHTDADFGLNNGSIKLSIAGGNAPYTITWTGPSGFMSTDSVLASLVPGTYCATVTDNYCGVATLCVEVGEKPATSVATVGSALSLNIAPNPFSRDLTLDFGDNLTGKFIFSLTGLLGQEVFSQSLSIHNQRQVALRLPESLPSGAYVLTVQPEHRAPFSRLLIRR